jgi:hypothetical protein
LYKFKPTTSHPDAKWNEAKYRWPAKADALAQAIHDARDDYDVYLCPYLMRGRRRTPGDVVSLTKVHADIDGDCPLDKVADLGGWAISTGSPGHAHGLCGPRRSGRAV